MSVTHTTKTADDYRAAAAECSRKSQESFDRSDTDGFLSQWANDITARRHRQDADIVDAGGVATFFLEVVTDLDGKELEGHVCNTRYGRRWRVELADGTVVWANTHAARESTYTNKGFRVERREFIAPAKARIEASGRGLSGAASAYVRTVPADPQVKFTGCLGVGDCREAE